MKNPTEMSDEELMNAFEREVSSADRWISTDPPMQDDVLRAEIMCRLGMRHKEAKDAGQSS